MLNDPPAVDRYRENTSFMEPPAVDRFRDNVRNPPAIDHYRENVFESNTPTIDRYRENDLQRDHPRMPWEDTPARATSPYNTYKTNSLLREPFPDKSGRLGQIPADRFSEGSYKSESLPRGSSQDGDYPVETAASRMKELYGTLRSNGSLVSQKLLEPKRKPYKENPSDLSI